MDEDKTMEFPGMESTKQPVVAEAAEEQVKLFRIYFEKLNLDEARLRSELSALECRRAELRLEAANRGLL